MPNQKNNKIYRIANHLQVVMSAINLLFLYFYVRSINFVVCTSASNFLEYIKILPVNKNILLVLLYISYIYERRKKAGSSTL